MSEHRCPTCGQPVRVVSSGEGTNSYAVPSSPPPPTAPEPLRTGERVEFGPRVDGSWLPAVVVGGELPGHPVAVRWEDTGQAAYVSRSSLRRAGRESSDG